MYEVFITYSLPAVTNSSTFDLEQVISAMIPSSTGSSVDPVESATVNSLATQQGYRKSEDMSFKHTPKENENQP